MTMSTCSPRSRALVLPSWSYTMPAGMAVVRAVYDVRIGRLITVQL
jgi:hypothetical protein